MFLLTMIKKIVSWNQIYSNVFHWRILVCGFFAHMLYLWFAYNMYARLLEWKYYFWIMQLLSASLASLSLAPINLLMVVPSLLLLFIISKVMQTRTEKEIKQILSDLNQKYEMLLYPSPKQNCSRWKGSNNGIQQFQNLKKTNGNTMLWEREREYVRLCANVTDNVNVRSIVYIFIMSCPHIIYSRR